VIILCKYSFILLQFVYLIFLFDNNKNKKKVNQNTEGAIEQCDLFPKGQSLEIENKKNTKPNIPIDRLRVHLQRLFLLDNQCNNDCGAEQTAAEHDCEGIIHLQVDSGTHVRFDLRGDHGRQHVACTVREGKQSHRSHDLRQF
jgi:hypothetical protein